MITLEAGSCQLELSDTGGLRKIYFKHLCIAEGTGELFRFRLRSKQGEKIWISSRDFRRKRFSESTFIFSHQKRFPPLKVKIALKAGQDAFFFRPMISGIPDGWGLEWLDVPELTVNARNELFHPRSEGAIIRHPEQRKYRPPDIENPDFYLDNYPGRCQMQFMAAWRQGKGLYYAAHDAQGTPKRILYSGTEHNRKIRLRLETACGAVTQYTSPFEYVVGGFSGNWMDACKIYRQWAIPTFGSKQKKIPAWMKDSPVTLIYSVRGDGSIKDSPNSCFPYIKGLKHIKKYATCLDSRIMAILMRWDGHGPWLPPELWPPLGGAEMLTNFCRRVHQAGHLLGLYGSGTAWTLKSHSNHYDASEDFSSKNLGKYMCANADGSLCPEEMGGIRKGYHMCITESYPKKIISEQIQSIAEAGIDFLQYFDQNIGCNNYLCYAKNHRHPIYPGAWSTLSMRKLLHRQNQDLGKKGREMILGTEGAAAEPYLGELPFNDLRSSLYFGDIPVPAYQFVYHGHTFDFMGNQVHMARVLDLKKGKDNFLFRIGWSFVSGVMLSIPMRADTGDIHWSIDCSWEILPPEQKNVIRLIRNLNKIRKENPDIFLYGRMEKDFILMACEFYELRLRKTKMKVKKILSSAWTTPEGRKFQILANAFPKSEKAVLEIPETVSAYIHHRLLTGKCNITIPPLSALIMEIKS